MRRLRPFPGPMKARTDHPQAKSFNKPTDQARNHPDSFIGLPAWSWQTCCLSGSIRGSLEKTTVVTVTGSPHSSIPTAESVLGALAAAPSHFEVDHARTDEIAEKNESSGAAAMGWCGFCQHHRRSSHPNREYFIEWLHSGKAFVVRYLSSDTFHGFPKFVGMIGGEFLTHGPQVEVTARVEDRHHPACQHYGNRFRCMMKSISLRISIDQHNGS